MSLIDYIIGLLKSFFKKSASAPTTTEPVDDGVFRPEKVPRDDPRVLKCNRGNGLITKIAIESGCHYWLTYQNGRTYMMSTPGNIDDYVRNGICTDSKLDKAIAAVQHERDLSKFSEQDIFEGKIWLGHIVAV